jgi:hypothetical protein
VSAESPRQAGSSDFGNWQRAAQLGLLGLNPVLSIAGLVLILGAGGMLMFFGFLPALAYLLVAVLVFGPLAVKVGGKSLFARLVRRASFVRAVRRRETAYLSGPLSPVPHGRFRLPGLLAASQLFEARDAYGEAFAMLRVPVTNSYVVPVRADADGDALVDPEAVDTMVATWSGFLQALPQWPDLRALSVTVEAVPDPGNRIATEVERMRADAPDAQPASGFTSAVMGELAAAATVGSAALHTRLALVFACGHSGRGGGRGERRGDRRGPEEMAVELGTQLPDMLASLAGTGAGAARALSADQLAATAWAAFHPAEAAEVDDTAQLEELDWGSVGPAAARERWDRYLHDSGISVSWLMDSAPRGAVPHTVLKRLLEPHPHLPAKRVTLYYRPLDPAAAAAWADRQTKAIATTPGQRIASRALSSSQAEANARDEARGASVTRFAVVTTVTVTDETQLRRAVAAMRNLHASARLVMHQAYGQQAAAFSFGLGFGVLAPDHVTLPRVLTL